MDIHKMISDTVKKNTFCYAKFGGQGYVYNNECECFCNEDKKLDCQAHKDKEKFHSYFKDLHPFDNDFVEKRNKILNEIKDEFKDSQWFKDNVK